MKFTGCAGAIVMGALAIGCGGAEVNSVFVMAPAPARPDNCPLELVSVDPMKPTDKWQMLGTIHVSGKDLVPTSPDVRALVHPRACAMGGTSIAIWTQTVVENSGATAFTFMVLRPKPTEEAAPPPPTSF